MSRKIAVVLFTCAAIAGCGGGAGNANTATQTVVPAVGNAVVQTFSNATGTTGTLTTQSAFDTTSAFFQPLGTNGRNCGTCHQASQGMSISAASARALFSSTNGTDPLFAAIDGANFPTAAVGDAAAHSLLLNNGLIRVAVTLPANAQFTIVATHDPYGTAITTDVATGRPSISVYRRPLPATSLVYLSDVMWDTRETGNPLNAAAILAANLDGDLTQQLLHALTSHSQSTVVPTAAQQSAILAFEKSLFTAQVTDSAAGSLTANGAAGGPNVLVASGYYPGINDAFGGDPQGKAFNQNAFTLYTVWNRSGNGAQASIARGENIFNRNDLNITNVPGINDNTALGSPNVVRGTCTTCHDAPNLGHHSLPLAMDIGIVHNPSTETDNNVLRGLAQLTSPDLPVFQITGCRDANNNAVIYRTTDPGKALITGQCADVSRVKVPVLRGLAARAPYFHNGSASSLAELVDFYNNRFGMNLNQGQKQDLINFLNAL